MIIKRWLTIAANSSTRLTAKRPSMEVDEVAIYLTIDIPNVLFARPQIEASIRIDPERVRAVSISEDTMLGLEDLLRERTGLDMHLRIIDPQEGAA